jgi:hypothetical protein
MCMHYFVCLALYVGVHDLSIICYVGAHNPSTICWG